MLGNNYTNNDLFLIKQSYSFVLALFTDMCRGNEKPFICHLVGTASILADNQASPVVIAVGLLHATYAQGVFSDGSTGITKNHQYIVKNKFGDEVEALLTEYTKFPWGETDIESLLVNHGTYSNLTKSLIFLRIANALEDHLDAGTCYNTKDMYRKKPQILFNISKLADRINKPSIGNQLLELYSKQKKLTIPHTLICTTAYSFNPKLSRSFMSWRSIIARIIS